MKQKNFFNALGDLLWLTQLGLSMLLPLLLCLAGCWWLVSRQWVGYWVYPIGIVLGLGAGAVSFRDFRKLMLRRAKGTEKEQKERPVSFNRHY